MSLYHRQDNLDEEMMTENSPFHGGVDVGQEAFYRNRNTMQAARAVSQPQAQYHDGNNWPDEDNGHLHSRRVSNDAQFGAHTRQRNPEAMSNNATRSNAYRAYEPARYVTTSHSTPERTQPSSSSPHYSATAARPVENFGRPRSGEDELRDVPYRPHQIARKSLPFSPELATRQVAQYHGLRIQDPGVQYAGQSSPRLPSPYASGTTSNVYTPDRSTIGSPIPRMSPDSLQRELDKLRESSEHILTQLIETEQLVQARDAEIARLRSELSNQSRGHGRGGSEGWEGDSLRRRLFEQDQNLRSLQADSTEAHRVAQEQRQRADSYRDQLSGLRESQSRITTDPAIIDAMRRDNDFFKKRADQLSRDNMAVTQQNRRLEEELVAVQRELQQRKRMVGSLPRS